MRTRVLSTALVAVVLGSAAFASGFVPSPPEEEVSHRWQALIAVLKDYPPEPPAPDTSAPYWCHKSGTTPARQINYCVCYTLKGCADLRETAMCKTEIEPIAKTKGACLQRDQGLTPLEKL